MDIPYVVLGIILMFVVLGISAELLGRGHMGVDRPLQHYDQEVDAFYRSPKL